MLVIWNFRYVGYLGCGMFEKLDVCGIECAGRWMMRM